VQKEAADDVALKINHLISEFRKNRLARLAEASPKELCSAVRADSSNWFTADDTNLLVPDQDSKGA